MRKRKEVIKCMMILSLLLILLGGCQRAPEASIEVTEITGERVVEAFPELAASTLANAELVALPEDVVIYSGDIVIRESLIDERVEDVPDHIREQLLNNKFFIVEHRFEELFLLERAREMFVDSPDHQGLSDRELFEDFYFRLTADIEVTQEEMREFYESNRAMMGDAGFSDVAFRIEVFLLQQKQEAFLDAYLRDQLRDRVIYVSDRHIRDYGASAIMNPIEQVRANGRPSMINFGRVDNPTCQRMAPAREAIRNKYRDRVDVVFIPVDKETYLSSRFAIRMIPTTIFFDGEGLEVKRLVGLLTEQEMEQEIERLL